MVRTTSYVTIITLSNGKEYTTRVWPDDVFELMERLYSEQKEFWEIHGNVHIKLSDISSIEQKRYKAVVI